MVVLLLLGDGGGGAVVVVVVVVVVVMVVGGAPSLFGDLRWHKFHARSWQSIDTVHSKAREARNLR